MTPTGRDLIGVQNLMKKHQALQAEVTGHDPRIYVVADMGKQMIDDGHFASDEIAQKIQGLTDRWQQLKVREASGTHRQCLATRKTPDNSHCTQI